ncbi:hypothetical protein [Micromonospora sp. NPDC047074]
MAVDLYARVAVTDHPTALARHERLLGSRPRPVASDTGAVGEPADHRPL